jgi:predicted transcriptional regulator
MTKEQIEAVLERVKTWPKERQEEAAELLLAVEALGPGVYMLSEEERPGVERGLRDADAGKFAADEEVEALFKRHRT